MVSSRYSFFLIFNSATHKRLYRKNNLLFYILKFQYYVLIHWVLASSGYVTNFSFLCGENGAIFGSREADCESRDLIKPAEK